MKPLKAIAVALGIFLIPLLLDVTTSFAQQADAGPGQTQAPAQAQPPSRLTTGAMPFIAGCPGMPMSCCCPRAGFPMGRGMGGMGMGEMGCMGGMHGMMGMPGMMGKAMMIDPKRAAKLMEMRAEMMKAAGEIMEKYAKELEAGK